jgi:hypothetical protein
MTREEAARIIHALAAAFPSANIPTETVAIYVENLIDLPVDDGMIAASNLIRTENWFPPIAKIRSETRRVGGALSPSREQAWLEVEMAMRHKGRGKRVEWSHDAISESVRTMGWTNMCLSENLDVVRGQFFKVYDSISGRVNREEQIQTAPALEAGRSPVELRGVIRSL